MLGDTVLATPHDAGVLRVGGGPRGVALATDGNGRYARLDPYDGARLALAEAYRNVAAAGARPLAVTNCLNFGSPEDPAVMWQFERAVTGLADACAALGTPVTGGNVSFYNQTGETAIHPTPVVGVLGVLDDVSRRTAIGFGRDGDEIWLLGTTREELGGSAWASVIHDHLGGRPPSVDLDAERALAGVLIAAAADGLLTAAHDLSDGGLAAALTESCLRAGRGCRVTLKDPFTELFSESQARAVVALAPHSATSLESRCATAGVPATRLGTVTGDTLEIANTFTIPLNELRTVYESTLPTLFDAEPASLS